MLRPKSERRSEFEAAFRRLCQTLADDCGLTLLYTMRRPAIPGSAPTYKAVVSDGITPPRELVLGHEATALLHDFERYVATGEASPRVEEFQNETHGALVLPSPNEHRTAVR